MILSFLILLALQAATDAAVRQKTTAGGYCVFPFTYKDVKYYSCTTKDRIRPWCSTTANFDRKTWGNCEGYISSGVKTISGEYCAFPFMFSQVKYWSCTTKTYTRPWCATTTDYSKDRKWGACAGFYSGSKKTTEEYCAFPFVYRRRKYKNCIKLNDKTTWCATTANYDRDKKWGICA